MMNVKIIGPKIISEGTFAEDVMKGIIMANRIKHTPKNFLKRKSS
jgi:hypothetical protein